MIEAVSNPDLAWPDELDAIIEAQCQELAKNLPEQVPEELRVQAALQIQTYCILLRKARQLRGAGRPEDAARLDASARKAYEYIPTPAKW